MIDHELGVGVGVAHGLDNGGKGEFSSVRTSGNAEQDVGLHVETPVAKNHLHVVPSQLPSGRLLSKASTLLDEALELKEADLVGCHPLSRQSWRVDEEEEAQNSHNNSRNTLEDEDPSPALITTNTVHLRNSSSKETRESARQSTSTVKVGDAGGKVLGHVPESTEVHGTGVEASLEHTEKHANSKKSTEAFDDTVQGHDYTPDSNKDTKVDRWSLELLQKDVARDLEQDVRDEEKTQYDVVLVSNKVEICCETLDLGIADVGAVEMGD
ncbi:hypothetical protein HG530_008475 [Fusarium avenaceum]|nr:hypothetical protein HG530_008475 [Fusarium avenaceum]